MKAKWNGGGNLKVGAKLYPPGSTVDLPAGFLDGLSDKQKAQFEPIAEPAAAEPKPKRRGRPKKVAEELED